MRTLEPGLRIRVVNRLLERYLAEQGNIELLKERHAYTKDTGDLAPADLSAFIEADRGAVPSRTLPVARKERINVVG
jgi:hypothetical protein